ncbi:MAG TPA: hypothetical protein DEA99_01440 [Candidatus Omnitrophica bacterium]|nr:hypothetical protein [Candidatus Omnitrophota bacterium]
MQRDLSYSKKRYSRAAKTEDGKKNQDSTGEKHQRNPKQPQWQEYKRWLVNPPKDNAKHNGKDGQERGNDDFFIHL